MNHIMVTMRRSFSHFVLVVVYHPFQRGDRLYTSESDVYRRQILTSKDDPHTERIKTYIMTVDI